MTRDQKRISLIAVLGLLVALVVADQIGVLPGAGDDADDAPEQATSARSLYLARAGLAEKQEGLIAQSQEWKSAAEKAQQQWEIARQRMIIERTVELAEARFRDRTLDAVKDLNLSAMRVTPVRDRTPATGAGPGAVVVQPLVLEVKFDAANHRDVYSAIDRFESMASMATNISAIRIDGPARVQAPHTITVSLTLQAQAAVGEEGAEHG